VKSTFNIKKSHDERLFHEIRMELRRAIISGQFPYVGTTHHQNFYIGDSKCEVKSYKIKE